jgi:hypothetical protein
LSLTGLIFLLAYAGGCLAALARHPVYGLMTYVGVFYLHPPSRWWGQALPDLRWSLLAALVTLIATMVHRKQVDPVPLFHHKVMMGLLLFVVWIAIQTGWAMGVGYSRRVHRHVREVPPAGRVDLQVHRVGGAPAAGAVDPCGRLFLPRY